jgi:hypothetical protein
MVNKGCSKLITKRKEAKLQWLRHLSKINEDSLNNVTHEGSMYFRNKKEEISKKLI